MIWLRHRHFFSLAAAMVVATALIWPALRVVSTGHEVNIEPLWRAAGATLTLGRTLRRDSPVERAAPRSLPLRRLAMLPLVAGTCLIFGACTDADKLSQLADEDTPPPSSPMPSLKRSAWAMTTSFRPAPTATASPSSWAASSSPITATNVRRSGGPSTHRPSPPADTPSRRRASAKR